MEWFEGLSLLWFGMGAVLIAGVLFIVPAIWFCLKKFLHIDE